VNGSSWPTNSRTDRFVLHPDATVVLLERARPGAARVVREHSVVVRLALSLSGPPNGIAEWRRALVSIRTVAEEDGPQRTWIFIDPSLVDLLTAAVLGAPAPAGVVSEFAVDASGDASAIEALLEVLGVDAGAAETNRAFIMALAEAAGRDGAARSTLSQTSRSYA
jgi:hypothetical protein